MLKNRVPQRTRGNLKDGARAYDFYHFIIRECLHVGSNFLDDFFRPLVFVNVKIISIIFVNLKQYTIFQFPKDFSLLFYVLYILFYDRKEFYII